ncbi:MAG: hypothetical protein MI741_14830, partial [Rhodospirillales bacterium]|nr:hypothetical protein [Rhodospirillales bacterium]
MMTYVWIAVAGAAVCVFGWLLLKWKQRGGRGMRSLVLLLNKPRLMNENVLRRHVEMAWGIQFPEGEDAKEFVVGQKPSFVVQTRANTFLVNVFDQPYVDDPAESATQIGELRLRKAVADHRAWLSVDLLSQNER